MTAPFGAWGTQTFIAGLTHDSLIAPWVIKGAMNGEAFAAYIRQVLAPELLPGTVVICDNLATHRNKDAAQALKDVGCCALLATILAGSQSDRNGLLETESTPSKDRCQDL